MYVCVLGMVIHPILGIQTEWVLGFCQAPTEMD